MKDEQRSCYALQGAFTFTGLVLPTPGNIKVRALVGDNLYKIGSLRVIQHPDVAAPREPSIAP